MSQWPVILRVFTYKMAAKINWHRYRTKLRHCHPMYWCCPHSMRLSAQRSGVRLSVRQSVCPSVCLSRRQQPRFGPYLPECSSERSSSFATAREPALPDIDRCLQAPEQHLRVASCWEPRFEAQHELACTYDVHVGVSRHRRHRAVEAAGVRGGAAGGSVCRSGAAAHRWRSAAQTVSTGASLDLPRRRPLDAAGQSLESLHSTDSRIESFLRNELSPNETDFSLLLQ